MKILKWLFSRPNKEMSRWEIILWWEVRRIPYNIIVGFWGLICLIIFEIAMSSLIKPGEDAVEPMAIILVPFVINIFYTAGWAVENILRFIFGRKLNIGNILFGLGLAFSLFVVSVPAALSVVLWLLKLIGVMR